MRRAVVVTMSILVTLTWLCCAKEQGGKEAGGEKKKAEKTENNKAPTVSEGGQEAKAEEAKAEEAKVEEAKAEKPATATATATATEPEAEEAKAEEPATATATEPEAEEAKAEKPAKATEPEAEEAKQGKGPFKHLPLEEVKKRQSRYAPVPIRWDKTLLNEKETEVVRTLVRAARVMDHLFWVQASPDGLEWRKKLSLRKDPEARALFHYLLINYGAYDRLNSNEPFLGETKKPKGANYYPTDMTKEEFEKWLTDHPDDAAAFRSNFTVIRRTGEGGLEAIPYSKEYKRELEAAAQLLEKAAELSNNWSLKKYLKARATGFLTDDYYESDLAWMDLDGKLEVVIGPYEVYEDHLFGYKAAFESFITVKDPEASDKLKTFAKWLDKLEKNLPIPEEHMNFKRGKSSPMAVVDVIFTTGDTKAGVQTIAFNLPNDERVREQKGSKKVMLRNVGRAKFEKILTPIAWEVLHEPLVPLLHSVAYNNHTMLHEVAHGLGPGTITINGEKTTVNLALKELYPHLEEAKADILGLYNALFLIDQGVIKLAAIKDGKLVADQFMTAEEAKASVVATFLAGIFRSTRFGVDEAHGKANLLIFNYLVTKGGVAFQDNGRVSYDFEKIVPAIKDCAHDLLMIQAFGNYDAGKAFIAEYGKVSDQMTALFTRLESIPVDIEPIYELP